MGSGLCFFDVCNPQKYLFINKSNYYIRFDFFNRGTKYGVILLPYQSKKLSTAPIRMSCSFFYRETTLNE